jgi:hypothetical protein
MAKSRKREDIVQCTDSGRGRVGFLTACAGYAELCMSGSLWFLSLSYGGWFLFFVLSLPCCCFTTVPQCLYVLGWRSVLVRRLLWLCSLFRGS